MEQETKIQETKLRRKKLINKLFPNLLKTNKDYDINKREEETKW